ncbi:MAG TPA: murein biosynthesis integral membrane protein MurJ [Acidimicrobiales bacterium]|nr:murein biosynthesis integral membrane protein MurJ [Acidimicrobiales bacterium]
MSGPDEPLAPAGPEVAAPNIIRSSAVMAVGTAASRLTGFMRLAAMAYALGVGRLTDTYTLANTTPNIVYELLLGGVLSATLVPVFVHHFEDGDEDGPSAIVTVTAVLLAAVTVAGIVAAPWILQVYSSTVEGDVGADQRLVGTALLRMFMPQMFFYGMTAMATALLNSRRHFGAPAVVPALNNLVVTAMLLAIPRVAGHGNPTLEEVRDDRTLLWLLGFGTTAGIVVMTVALWPFIRRAGIHLRWVFDLRHTAVREVVRLSGWTVAYVVTNQVALLVVLLLANKTAGGVASYTIAFVFFQLPHALIAVSLMSALVPEMSSAARAGDMAAYKHHFSLGIRLISLVVMPAAVGYIVLADPIVSALVEYGAARGSVEVIAECLALFAVGLLGFSLYLFTLRGFYARRDTRTPFFLNLVENAINIALALALEPWLGVKGLALALALAYSISALIAFATLRRRVGLLGGRRLALAVGKIGVASAVMAAAVVLVASQVGSGEGAGAVLRTAVGVVVGVAAFTVTVVALRTDELDALRRRLTRA